MAETDAVVAYLLSILAEERRLHEAARQDMADAALRERTHAATILSIEGTLERVTKDTPAPYVRQQPSILPFPRFEVEYKPAPKPRPPTKRTIVYQTVKANPGLKASEVHKAIPKDAPLEITHSDVHRNLGKLKADGRIYAKEGRYYPYEEGIKESEATG